MTSLLRSLLPARVEPRASAVGLPFDQWVEMMGGGLGMFPFLANGIGQKEEEIGGAFADLQRALRVNGVVFACELVRVMLFSEARFMYRQRRSGRPGDMFSRPDLRILERPRPGDTTAALLKRAMLHADFGGTGFMVRRGDRIRQPRPDWMTIVLGSNDDPDVTGDDLDAEVVGYLYHPGGRLADQPPVVLLPEQVATFIPIPDPMAHVRGIPWTSTVTRNIMGHNAATTHKLKFFENGATPQLVVSFDKDIKDQAKIRTWIEVLDQDHAGLSNAYKTMYLAAGAVPTVVGKDMKQLDFKATQGADETLIAAAAGVGAVVAQLSEGLQGSSLNSGNFAEAMRRVADITMRPLWRDMAASLEVIVPTPPDAELWYDDSDIPALKDDIRAAAEVRGKDMSSIRTGIDAGFEPDDVVDAIVAGDLKRLRGKHSGLYSVQLQKPGGPAGAADQPVPSGAAAEAPVVPLLASGEGLPGEVRCSCGKLLAELATPPYRFSCPRCKAPVEAGAALVHGTELEAASPTWVRIEPQTIAPVFNLTVPQGITVAPAEAKAGDVVVNVPEQPAPVVNVAAPDVQITTPAPVVNVAAAEQPAPVVNVNVPDQPAPVVNVPAPVVNVEAPVVNVSAADQPAPVVNVTVPEQPAPVVNVPAAAVTVEAPIVHVAAPDVRAGDVVVNVDRVRVVEMPDRVHELERDDLGRPTGSRERDA